MFEVIPIPAFKDNYIWVGICRALNQAIVIDPGDGLATWHFLRDHHLNLVTILITHKHQDHTGGVDFLLHHYPNIPVYGKKIENMPSVNAFVEEGDRVEIDGWSMSFQVIAVPGHTLGHVCYYMPGVLFCGDTLFGAGCGRVFEGTFEQMYHSLTKLSSLPPDTLVYCAHEYTLSNLKFAHHLDPDNQAIRNRILETKSLLSRNKPSIPFTISLEKTTNPFLRCKEENIIKTVEDHSDQILRDDVAVFREMRKWKDGFS